MFRRLGPKPPIVVLRPPAPVGTPNLDAIALRIQTLSLFLPIPLTADSERHVLLGLTNLTTLQVQSWAGRTVPEVNHLTKLLAHTPRLQALRIDGDSWNVSADLLRYTPLLIQLSIRNNPHQKLDLPGELLVHTPHLEALHVEGRHPSAGLVQLLAHAPRLARLTVMPSTPLLETFLATLPQLTHLTVGDRLEPCDIPQLLASVPRLRHVAVRMNADAQALDCLADSLRRYAPALDRLEIELHDLQDLNAGMLSSLPRLSHLTLDVVGLTSLPEPLLAQVPELTHLTLAGLQYDPSGRVPGAHAPPDGPVPADRPSPQPPVRPAGTRARPAAAADRHIEDIPARRVPGPSAAADRVADGG